MPYVRETLEPLTRAVADAPRDAAAHHTLGGAYALRGELGAAVDAFRAAVRLAPTSGEYARALGVTLADSGQKRAAIDAYLAGLAAQPDDNVAACALGVLFDEAGEPERAVHAYAQAIARAPDNFTGYSGLYTVLVAGRSAEEADALARPWMPASVDPVMPAIGLARGLERNGRYPEARPRWSAIIEKRHDKAFAVVCAAGAYVVARDYGAAEHIFERARQIAPTNVEIAAAEMKYLWRTGQIERVRARFRDTPEGRSLMLDLFGGREGLPVWDGSQSLDGQTIIVRGLGGFGDVLQYCRFAAVFAALGARVLFEAPLKLHAVLATVPGIDRVIAPFDPCPDPDYQCRLEPTCLLTHWDWATVERPYVRIDEGKREDWRRRLGDRRRHVGIVWRSRSPDARNGYTFRSAPLAAFEELARVPDLAIHGLQVGPGTEELTPATGAWLTDNLELSFEETGAAIQAMDAVITMDSSVAHLAGASGAPTIILLPYFPDYRWMTDAPDFDSRRNLWYPTARFYRQAQPGEWRSLLAQCARDLAMHFSASRDGAVRLGHANA